MPNEIATDARHRHHLCIGARAVSGLDVVFSFDNNMLGINLLLALVQ